MKKNSYKYKPIKILGQGSYGKAYLVECNDSYVKYDNIANGCNKIDSN